MVERSETHRFFTAALHDGFRCALPVLLAGRIRQMKALNVAVLLSFLVASISINVDAVAAETSKTSTECTVARVAERYIATHYPDFDSVKNPPIVRDEGKIWIVEYQLPEGMIGGTPRIEIEKSSFKVLRALHTQ
jgi:hypothetical protein